MSKIPMKFFNPFEEIRKTGKKLPHWEQPGACFFITFRLADSLPERKLRGWRAEREIWVEWNPPPWTEKQEVDCHRRFSCQIDRWLDAGEGSCVLESPAVQLRLASALLEAQGDAFMLHSFVIMPNHVHLLSSLRQGEQLGDRMMRWKGGSSRQVNEGLQRSGTLWQRDYFDRLVRDTEHFANCRRYIRRNPEKARLTNDRFMLWEAEWLEKSGEEERGVL